MDKKVEDLKTHIKQLSEKRNLCHAAMDFLQEGLLIIEKDEDIAFYNSSFVKHLDIQVKSSLLTIGDLRRHPIFGNILHETQKTDFIHYARDVEIFSPWRKHLNIRAVALDRKKPSKSVVYIIQDTTFLKRKQEETFQQKKLGAVLSLGAGFAHEIGNPLNSLNIHLQIMKRILDKGATNKRQLAGLKKEITILEGEVKRMDNVISNFLKATRPEKVCFKEIDIVETVRLSLESLRGVAEKRSIGIDFHSSFERKFLFADAQKIQQAIINIVQNAIEAIGEGGQITVSCTEREGGIDIAITDDGPGILKEALSMIFDPFFTTKSDGVGLGLVISYQIIKEHDGDISVKSFPGEGTTFLIRLPLREYKLKFIEDSKK